MAFQPGEAEAGRENDVEVTAPTLTLPPQMFASRGEAPDPAKVNPIENGHWKPTGGLWTSTLDEEERSDWQRWYESEDWGNYTHRWKLVPTEARVAVVRDPDELETWYERYPAPTGIPIRAFAEQLDYKAMAEDFDAVTFPEPWSHRFGDHFGSMLFYTLDAESTCWFRWCFESVEELP